LRCTQELNYSTNASAPVGRYSPPGGGVVLVYGVGQWLSPCGWFNHTCQVREGRMCCRAPRVLR
jgi:hypothetical protein